MPPLLVKVPRPAVELPAKIVMPPLAPLTAPPLLVKLPSPAVEVLLNSVRPGLTLLAAAALFVKVPLPAVESSLNRVKLAVCAVYRASGIGEDAKARRSSCY